MSYRIKYLKNKISGLFFSESTSNRTLQRLLTSSNHPRILFICQGNICRSPYAECYLKSISGNNLEVASAGLSTRPGLKANESAIQEAKKRGLNLESHLTKVATREMIQNFDIIFCMEPTQALKITRSLTNQEKPALLLGLFADEDLQTKTITDPYGLSDNVFSNTFQVIESACININQIITNDRGTSK